MRLGSTAGFVVLLGPILTFSGLSAAGGAEKADPNAVKRYESPKAVFEAYRVARQKRDSCKLFSLMTAEVQNAEVFEAFFECMELRGADVATARRSDTKEIDRIIKEYVDTRTLDRDYEKAYQKKHGIDLKKFTEDHQHDKTPVSAPPQDEELVQSVVAAHVEDKAGFFEAVEKYLHERAVKEQSVGPVHPLGDLQQLAVHGDTAEGRAKETILPNVAGGEGPLKSGESPAVYDRSFKFRRVNGGWLIDSL